VGESEAASPRSSVPCIACYHTSIFLQRATEQEACQSETRLGSTSHTQHKARLRKAKPNPKPKLPHGAQNRPSQECIVTEACAPAFAVINIPQPLLHAALTPDRRRPSLTECATDMVAGLLHRYEQHNILVTCPAQFAQSGSDIIWSTNATGRSVAVQAASADCKVV
jgi:hypothetical protein